MKSFLDYLKHGPRKTVTVYHGSAEKRKSLSLPKTHNKANADGHGIYLSTHKGEAAEYGKHVHEVEFSFHPHEVMDLDASTFRNTGHVKKAFEAISEKHGIPLGGEGEHTFLPTARNVDIVHRLGKKIGYEKATEEFKRHGIVGGWGESDYGPSGNRTPTKVYSVYDSSRLKVKGHEEVKKA